MTTQAILPFLTSASLEVGWDPARRQQALLALGRRAMERPGQSALVEDAAVLVAAMLGVQQCLVAELAASDREFVMHLRGIGSDDRSGDVVERVPSEPVRSLAGYVLQTGQAILVSDLARETRFEDRWLEKHGIDAVLAVPLGVPNRPLGVLAACGSNRRGFAQEDLLFAETVAQLVSTTVAWGRAEQRLAAQQRRSQKLLETVKAMVLVLDVEGRILEANRTCEQVSGFSFPEIRGRFLWNAFPVAQELELLETIFPQLLQEGNPVQYESSLLTKDSNWRHISWSCSAIRDETGAIDSILATGIDLTEQRRAEEQAAGVEAAVERAVQSVSRRTEERPATNAGPAGAGKEAASSTSSGDVPTMPDGIERRRRTRRLYPYQQLIAPVVDGNLPSPHDFYHVLCRDISAGGFSFLSAEPPAYDAVVVALGTTPSLTHLHAQRKHVTETTYQGKRAYVVGFAYTGRVFY